MWDPERVPRPPRDGTPPGEARLHPRAPGAVSSTPIVLALVLSALLAAPPTVTVPAGKTDPTTLVVRRGPVVIVPAGSFVMGADADDLKAARDMCIAELRGGGALSLEVAPRCNGRFD